MKFFKLDTLQLYVWKDQIEFSFKIVTPKRIYFFRALTQKDYELWMEVLE